MKSLVPFSQILEMNVNNITPKKNHDFQKIQYFRLVYFDFHVNLRHICSKLFFIFSYVNMFAYTLIIL